MVIKILVGILEYRHTRMFMSEITKCFVQYTLTILIFKHRIMINMLYIIAVV